MAKMRIWYVTDVINSNSNFYVPVESIEEAERVVGALTAYDMFQCLQGHKLDYTNAYGLEVQESNGDWVAWYSEDDEDFMEYINNVVDDPSSKDFTKLQKFSNALLEYNKGKI